eukprot:6199356-Pleurochrysis_carterae.AAC.8
MSARLIVCSRCANVEHVLERMFKRREQRALAKHRLHLGPHKSADRVQDRRRRQRAIHSACAARVSTRRRSGHARGGGRRGLAKLRRCVGCRGSAWRQRLLIQFDVLECGEDGGVDSGGDGICDISRLRTGRRRLLAGDEAEER